LHNLWAQKPKLSHVPANLVGSPFKMPNLIWQLLNTRDITTEDQVNNLIQPSLKDLSHPYKMDDMEKSCDRFLKALEDDEHICVYGDFDLDGSSGVALLNQGLSDLGFKTITLYQPKRLSEGYGVHPHAIEALKEKGVSLIITVDVGITGNEAVETANKLGIDMVITDHHLPKKVLPNSFSIVNPNKGTCPSGLGHLCGCGVGFYFLMGLKIKLENNNIEHNLNLKSLLDLFTIGTLTDLVPLVGENRSLVKYGLLELKNTKRPGLKALLKELNLLSKPALSSSDVAIRFAPKLNALSRLERGLLPLDIFIESDKKKAEELIFEVMENNTLRRKLQDQALNEALEIGETFVDENFVLACSEDFHQGVVGLVATRLSEEYKKCSFIGCIKGDKITGSARIPNETSFNLVEALEHCKDELEGFGGHAPAAGFHLHIDKLEGFMAKLKEFFDQKALETTNNESITGFYDLEATIDDFTPAYLPWIKKLEPFGVAFEEPVYFLKNSFLESYKELKGCHLRLVLASSVTRKTMNAIWFSPSIKPDEIEAYVGKPLNALVEAQANYFAGRETLQLMIKKMDFNV